MDLNIIYNDKSIVIVEKPAGVPAQPDKTGDMDLLTELNKKFGYVKVVHRLDRPVGGLMVYALNNKAESFLSKQMQNGSFGKTYYAVCCGEPNGKSGTLRDWLVKNQRLNISIVSNKGNKNAKEAILDYNVLNTVEDEKFGKLSLLEIVLHTGRHHQIRVQTSNSGFPLWGDTKYNETFKCGYYNVNIALYSSKIEFIHPETKNKITFKKKPEGVPFNLFT